MAGKSKFVLVVLLASVAVLASAFNYPERPDGRVTDRAGVLSGPAKSQLESRLAGIESQTGHQVAIALFPSLDGETIDQLGNQLFKRWQLGQRGKDDGLLLVMAMQDRKYRVEVGYGLEGQIPDARAASIARNQLVPALRRGDVAGGLNGFVDAVAPLLAKPVAAAAPVVSGTPAAGGSGGFPWLLICVPLFGCFIWWLVAYVKGQQEEAREAELERAARAERVRQETEEYMRTFRERAAAARTAPSPAHVSSAAGPVAVGAGVAAASAAAIAAAAAARRKREEEEAEEEERRRRKRHREEEEEESRRSSSYSSSSSSSSSDSFGGFGGGGDSFSGGGGCSGGGGASGGW